MCTIQIDIFDKKINEFEAASKISAKTWVSEKKTDARFLIRNSSAFVLQQLEVKLTEWKQISINMIAHQFRSLLESHENTNQQQQQRRTYLEMTTANGLMFGLAFFFFVGLEMVAQSEKYKIKTNYIQLKCSWAAVQCVSFMWTSFEMCN